MTLEGIQNYLGARLPLRPDNRELGIMILRLVVLAFLGALLVDVLTRPGTGAGDLLAHAGSVAIIYLVSVAIVSTSLLLGRKFSRHIRVWHLWSIALIAFVGGFQLVSIDVGAGRLAGFFEAHHDEPLSLLQLFPVWFLLTYLFVQPYLNASLRQEVSRLHKLNELIGESKPATTGGPDRVVRFESGRTRFDLPVSSVRNIVVDDHYCRIYYFENGKYGKRDISMTLRDVLVLLPPEFVRVHRSHVVNPSHVSSLRRKGRNLRVVLKGNYEVPVSRHRLDHVMPRFQQYAVASIGRGHG
jgi:hypothetical protein